MWMFRQPPPAHPSSDFTVSQQVLTFQTHKCRISAGSSSSFSHPRCHSSSSSPDRLNAELCLEVRSRRREDLCVPQPSASNHQASSSQPDKEEQPSPELPQLCPAVPGALLWGFSTGVTYAPQNGAFISFAGPEKQPGPLSGSQRGSRPRSRSDDLPVQPHT